MSLLTIRQNKFQVRAKNIARYSPVSNIATARTINPDRPSTEPRELTAIVGLDNLHRFRELFGVCVFGMNVI